LDHYRAQLLAQGEVLDLAKLAPLRSGALQSTNQPASYAPILQKHSRPFSDYTWSRSFPGQLSLFFPPLPSGANPTNRNSLWLALASDITTNRHHLPLLRAAFLHPAKDTGRDYRLGFAYPALQFGSQRQIAYFLHAAAISDLHSGRTADAFETTLTLMDITDYLREEWTPVNQLVRISIGTQALNATWYGLESHAWTESQLAQLQARWETASILTNLYQSLLYERAFGTYTFALARTNPAQISQHVINRTPVPQGLPGQLWEWWRLRTDLDGDELEYLHNQQAKLLLWREQIQHPAGAQGLNDFKSLHQKLTQNTPKSLLPRKHLITANLDVNHYNLFFLAISWDTHRHLTIAAIALERYRLQHGHYPPALAQLVPAYLPQIPLDPMDGRPLRYRLKPDNDYTLYSVGQNGRDDRGNPAMHDPTRQFRPGEGLDILWQHLDPIDLPQ
jgi:hypothetical protein